MSIIWSIGITWPRCSTRREVTFSGNDGATVAKTERLIDLCSDRGLRRGRIRCAPHVPRLRPRMGRLHPFAIRPIAARLLPLRPCRQARALLRQSLHVWRRLRHGRGLARPHHAVRPVRDAAAVRRDDRDHRACGDMAAGAPARRRNVGTLGRSWPLSLLLASCPQYYGHMFINPKDAPFAVAMMVLLLGLARALEEYPKPSIPTVLIFGIGLGLAIGSRILAGMAALYMLVPLAMIIGSESARRRAARKAAANFGRFVLILLPGLVLAYAIMAWSGRGPCRNRSIRCARSAISRNSSKSPGRRCSRACRSRCRTCRATTSRFCSR